jgi:hypothetical protein
MSSSSASTKSPEHVVFNEGRISGDCAACKQFAQVPHVLGMLIYCAKCCPKCNYEWTEPQEISPVAGDQQSLF